jgi:molybdate transport system substrate-binding protein
MMRFGFGRRLAAATLLFAATSLAQAADLTVSAAASLTDAFREIGRAYEAQHPGTKILLNFGASGALLQQMAKGAPVDVFASADQETMDAAVKQGLVAPAERQDFVRNTLVLVVPRDSKLPLRALPDLRQDAVRRIAIGNPASVPVGRYARRALVAAELWNELGPRMVPTQNVRQVLDYVARGEADAGFVYGTDAALMKDRIKVAFTVPLDVTITYPIAATASSNNAKEARRFVAFVRGDAAQSVLSKYGFHKP